MEMERGSGLRQTVNIGRGAWNRRPHIIPDVNPPSTAVIPPQGGGGDKRTVILPGYKAMKRPDKGGSRCIRSMDIATNHFQIEVNHNTEIRQYSVEVRNSKSGVKSTLLVCEADRVWDELCSCYPGEFTISNTVYDGKEKMFSIGTIPNKIYTVELPGKRFNVNIKYVKMLKLRDLSSEGSSDAILQTITVVLKELYCKRMVTVDRNQFSRECFTEDQSCFGLVVRKGYRHTMKTTAQGFQVCVDYSTYIFNQQMAVNEYLKEFFGIKDNKKVKRLPRHQVAKALIGLKVVVEGTEYSIKGVDEDISFLVLSKERHVVMDLCNLVEGQKIRRDRISGVSKEWLKTVCLVYPKQRKVDISRAMDSEPSSGEAINHFGIKVDKKMLIVQGRVLQAPRLKLKLLKNDQFVRQELQAEDNKWSLTEKRLTRGSIAKQWAVIDFAGSNNLRNLVNKIRERCKLLGVEMSSDYIFRKSSMATLSDADALEKLLQSIIDEGKNTKEGDYPSLILCAMSYKCKGYNTLKWVAETKCGLVTQCFLTRSASTRGVHYLISLALKINAKLGGSNAELWDAFPFFKETDQVMFIGADVNHPSPSSARDETCPSIVAITGTLNWPGANRYTSRIILQPHNKEEIQNFGEACLEIVEAHVNRNNGKAPNKIVIFRDGVSDQQFDMALNVELRDVQLTLEKNGYMPMLTLIVGQKRLQTRFFPSKEEDGCKQGGNVPSGTVIDTGVVHPYEADFYLISHHNEKGGTSRATRYITLYDDMKLSSDEIQRLVFDLCFISCRCTNPISLAPPIYYADMLAYRGRMYYDASKLERRKTRTSTSTLGSSISSLSIEEKAVFKLQLEDVMFFI